jgi:hypothetical protein
VVPNSKLLFVILNRTLPIFFGGGLSSLAYSLQFHPFISMPMHGTNTIFYCWSVILIQFQGGFAAAMCYFDLATVIRAIYLSIFNPAIIDT